MLVAVTEQQLFHKKNKAFRRSLLWLVFQCERQDWSLSASTSFHKASTYQTFKTLWKTKIGIRTTKQNWHIALALLEANTLGGAWLVLATPVVRKTPHLLRESWALVLPLCYTIHSVWPRAPSFDGPKILNSIQHSVFGGDFKYQSLSSERNKMQIFYCVLLTVWAYTII